MRNFFKMVLLALLCLALSNISLSAEQDYYPTDTWRTSTPEEQGMDSEKLYRMLKYISEEKINLHSLLVIRNGYLVHETYFYPYQKDVLHALNSCTKSVTSTLVGIALSEGKIKSIGQKVLDLFPDKKIVEKDPRKDQINIRHLLTMTVGMDWNMNSPNREREMSRSKDWVETVLNCPMILEPGERFSYSNGASHLLSAIVQKSTGISTLEYAQERLFKPLNMSIDWVADPNGIVFGAAFLRMKPLDMARFGYLYLKKGKWLGKQIVPEEWVEVSTKKQVDAINGMGYGYQWWIPTYGGYSACGSNGQWIYVRPQSNMVIVMTAAVRNEETFSNLIKYFILPAIKDEPLPANLETNKKIKQLSEQFENPKPNPVKKLPSIAKRISGKVFICKPNEWGINSLSLTFKEGTECIWKLDINQRILEWLVGLDGIYRINHVKDNDNINSCRGYWSDDRTFVVDWQQRNSAERYNFEFTFSNKQVNIITRQIRNKICEIEGNIEE